MSNHVDGLERLGMNSTIPVHQVHVGHDTWHERVVLDEMEGGLVADDRSSATTSCLAREPSTTWSERSPSDS